MSSFPTSCVFARAFLVVAITAMVLAAASPAAAQTNVSGVWKGQFTAQEPCGGTTYATTGTTAGMLYQDADEFGGQFVITANFVGANCTQTTSQESLVLAGTVTSGILTGNAVAVSDGAYFDLTGEVSGMSLVLRGTNAANGSSFQMTMTKTGEAFPQYPPNYSGTATMTYDAAHRCAGVPEYTSTRNVAGTLLVMQGQLSGVLSFSNGKDLISSPTGACVYDDSPGFAAVVVGTVNGEMATGQIFFEDEDTPAPFTGSFAQNGTMFMVQGQTAEGSFTMQLSASFNVEPPVISSFTATPSTIKKGQSVTLSWNITGATSAWIDNDIGIVSATTGTKPNVTPTATTKYTLTAMGPTGSATASATVTVDTSIPVANVVVAMFPGGMLQASGASGASTYYVLRNDGGADTSVTLTQSGNFFTQSPASFTLRAGASQTVTITALQMPVAAYDGTSIPAGTGVPSGLTIPIRLVVASLPTAPVTAGISGTSRVEVAATADTDPTGTVSFTNSGSGTLYGVLTSDVPWIEPYKGVVEIPPGQTKDFTFTTIRSKRPDASAAVGGMSGTITLTFFSGSGTGKGAQLLGTTPTSSVSVSIVDVVKPGVIPGTPPALGAGELGLFVAGLAAKSNAIGDLALSNLGGNAISDLKLFFSSGGSGASSVQTQLGSIAANAGLSFPGIVKNVFSSSAASGVVQIRSAQATSLSVSAVQLNPATGRVNTVTSMPVLRSDRAAASGSAIHLAGVRKDSVSHTDVYVQEVTGNAATVTIDFVDANGNVLSSRPADSLAAFGMLQVTDGVPANAKSVRVRNTSATTAKVGAFALVIDDNTGDAWSIVDNTSASADALYFAVPAPVEGLATREFSFTNSSATSMNVALTLWPSQATTGRRRAAIHSEGPAKTEAVERTLTLAPLQTVAVTDLQSGFARATATAGALHGGGMYTSVRNSVRPMGSGIPVVPLTSTLASGSTKRFTGVEDASLDAVAARTPSTYRTHLLLFESAGQSATVRLTLRYLFAAGSLVSSVATSSREVTLAANGSLELKDIGTSIIGPSRTSFGDLHNMQLDVQVVGGTGRVLALLESVDNASGDVTIRE